MADRVTLLVKDLLWYFPTLPHAHQAIDELSAQYSDGLKEIQERRAYIVEATTANQVCQTLRSHFLLLQNGREISPLLLVNFCQWVIWFDKLEDLLLAWRSLEGILTDMLNILQLRVDLYTTFFAIHADSSLGGDRYTFADLRYQARLIDDSNTKFYRQVYILQQYEPAMQDLYSMPEWIPWTDAEAPVASEE